MSYCINPYCWQRKNPESEHFCCACGTKLLINDCYRLIKPLRPLGNKHHTEVFEVEDRGTPKVIKILQADEESQKLIDLFQQEVKILMHLNHTGIPKAELDAYFKFTLSNGQNLHCLVMEKIEGQNLEDWVKQNGIISEEQALDWLKQIIEILDLVHQNNFFHRDIKPSNIMLRFPLRDLVLIDFGTARELTQTVINGQNVTIIYSHGYTAPEQIEGSAVPQSDFFALGRTFVYLLTGKEPVGKLLWRKNAAQISQQLADLIDNLMATSPNERPKDAKDILRRLDKIKLEKYKYKNKWLIVGLLSASFVAIAFIIHKLTTTPSALEILCFKDVPNVPKGIFNYGGSTTWAPIRQLIDPAIQTELRHFLLKYQNPLLNEGEPGSETGIKMLLSGRLDIVQSSRPFLKEENQQAQQQGFSLVQEKVAIDGVAVVVNHSLTIPGLTTTQLKEIYTGKIRNWQQVGGPNLGITPYAHHSTGWFRENILRKDKFAADVSFIENTTIGLRQVAQNSGAIYYASASLIVPQCSTRPLPIGRGGKFIPPYKEPLIKKNECYAQKNQINQKVFKNEEYPLTRNLFVIFKHYPSQSQIEEQAGKAYVKLLLTPQGQSLIEQAGYLPIRQGDRACPSP